MADSNVLQRRFEANASGAEGIRLIPSHGCYYPPAVKSADLLLVDFDQRAINRPGLYLVEEVSAGRVVWMGCRRFDVMPSGVRIDISGDGDWQPFIGNTAMSWRIAGQVQEVYRPTKNEGGR
ncbi:hypothetical protein AZSI13_31390 [Azospira sp. I13]|nr:hypothetical protein AZSI13_31390 [Azospira sp. I13]